jgi:clan AA aspartic protease (TIGR02281 family)
LYFFHVRVFAPDRPVVTAAVSNIETDIRNMPGKKKKTVLPRAAGKRVKIKDADKKSEPAKSEGKSDDPDIGTEVAAGWVIITDPWGRQVQKFRSVLAGSGWLTLPTRACLGGSRWFFFPDSGEGVEISGGIWIFGDKVGLWHLAGDSGRDEVQGLGSWSETETVSWTSIESSSSYDSVKLIPGQTEGYFVSASMPEHIDEAGVFIQGGKIVGWSFGEFLSKGYMWPGKAGADMQYKTWVKYFYNITFANGREEKFARALAMSKTESSISKFAALLEGFSLRPKLLLEDTPYYLMPEEIVKNLRILLTDAVHNGEGSEVVDLLSSQLLKNIGDMTLLIDLVPVIAAAQGYPAAINEIEDSGRYLVRLMGHEAPALDLLHVNLYQDWIQEMLNAGEFDEGWQAYNAAKNYFPEDPYIHLLGVELVLLNEDWEEAERLLYIRNYPPALQDRYQLLARQIAEMKGEEGKIVIRFSPGASRIPVTAAINEAVFQDFIVDTGASMITIPTSTADALGLERFERTRTLWTASGVETVSEVLIDAIEIDGWIEYDVPALVLDMPDRQGLGLLGLNYLGRFRMDLKSEEGSLYLTPR